MKTIKKGRKQKGWAKEVECTGIGHGSGGCGAILLIEEADIYETGSGGEGSDFQRTFKCQECGVETDLLQVPDEVWERTVCIEGSLSI